MKKHKSYVFYHLVTSILRFAGFLWFGGYAYGKENIPKKGRVILAGNHVSDFDAYLLFLGTKRPIHFLGKIELFQSRFAWFFRAMHLIPVDRKNKNPEAKNEAINILNDEKVLGIFPEGTYHKKDVLLPFKPGVISFAEKTDSLIVPFAIVGKFKFRSKPKIYFGKPINIKDIKSKDKLQYLEDYIRDMVIEKKNS